MGIINVTPDSFSGDGLLAPAPAGERRSEPVPEDSRPAGDAAAAVERAVAQARRMVEEGADLVDVGGESTRPGHAPVSADEELARVIPAIAAIHAALPDVPISVDTTKREVAAAAIDAGAAMLNDVWGVGPDEGMARLAASRGVPLVVMHNRTEPVYRDLVTEVAADLAAALERAMAAGVPEDHLIVDPGFGFGKTAAHNLELLRRISELRSLRRPILLGTSRKSTLGRVLAGLPPAERLEATLATTALGVAGGVDMVRVHDVAANVRAARLADAVVRGFRE